MNKYVFGKVLDVREIYNNEIKTNVTVVIVLKLDGTRERYDNSYRDKDSFLTIEIDYDWSCVVAGDYVEITMIDEGKWFNTRNVLKIIDKNELDKNTINELERL